MSSDCRLGTGRVLEVSAGDGHRRSPSDLHLWRFSWATNGCILELAVTMRLVGLEAALARLVVVLLPVVAIGTWLEVEDRLLKSFLGVETGVFRLGFGMGGVARCISSSVPRLFTLGTAP